MKLGFIILAHENLERVSQLTRHLAEQGCPSCVHIDADLPTQEFKNFTETLSDLDCVTFSKQTSCEWGCFSIVQATLDASEHFLNRFPEVTNVFLISGSCLPIRPIRQLQKFLERKEKTDFIESVSVRNNLWVKGGLSEERFTLFFPFSWRRQRKLFDSIVKLQRWLKIRRAIPKGIVPHIGSQWWCLTTRTLQSILDDPHRQYFDNYFGWSWIPDESYFQTLTRRHSEKIESRSLTFSKFDYQGKPFNFYDDHLPMLPLSDCFMTRKVWSGAEGLYRTLLDPARASQPMTKARPKQFDQVFEAADVVRCEGGEGRFHQGRFPYDSSDRAGVSPNQYTVFVGFRSLYAKFPRWVENNTDAFSFGSVFARGHVGGRKLKAQYPGNLPASTSVRNRNPKGYLSNLLWLQRVKHQCLLYDFRDNSKILETLAHDPNATIVLIRNSWLLRLLDRKTSFSNTLENAKRYHLLEQSFLKEFIGPNVCSDLQILDLEAAIQTPAMALRQAIEHIPGSGKSPLSEMPVMGSVGGLDTLVRKLRNHGLDIGYEPDRRKPEDRAKLESGFSKPYLVK